ncbi:MAG: hypothetical protein QF915_01640, partial [Candidatus Woesearchaeota archaeon]|nr:hypothetical protein [Candidatus Woesearchaeota archaeon]
AFNYLLDKNNGSEVNPSIMQRTDEIKSSILSQSDPVGLRAWQTAYKLYNLQKQLDTVMQRIK